MNMYLHELKALFRNALFWALGMTAIVSLYFSLYPSVLRDAAGFKNILSGYPPQVQAMLGVTMDSVTSALGFYSMVLTFVVLCGAIQAMHYGASLLSKETREHTADFLMVKPVSRRSIVHAKLLAALTLLVGTDLVYWIFASSFVAATVAAGFDTGVFALLNLTLLLVQLIFFSLGFGLSVCFNRLRAVLPVSLGTVFGFYLIGAVFATSDTDGSRYTSPFKYFSSPWIIAHGSYETGYLLAGLAIVVVGIGVAYGVYGRKDIHAVS